MECPPIPKPQPGFERLWDNFWSIRKATQHDAEITPRVLLDWAEQMGVRFSSVEARIILAMDRTYSAVLRLEIQSNQKRLAGVKNG